MRTGFKWFIAILVLTLLAFMFVPGLIMMFTGGGHV
jgi:hypothetical protein